MPWRGGPAYIFAGERKKVAGLTSRCTATTPCGEGGIDTRVDKQMDFVAEVARKAGLSLTSRSKPRLHPDHGQKAIRLVR